MCKGKTKEKLWLYKQLTDHKGKLNRNSYLSLASTCSHDHDALGVRTQAPLKSNKQQQAPSLSVSPTIKCFQMYRKNNNR